MRKIIKITIIAVISLLILASILANAYFLGWKSLKKSIIKKQLFSIDNKIKLLGDNDKNNDIKFSELENEFLQRGIDIAVSQIIQQLQQTGQVQIGDLILIEKQ